MSSIGPEVGFDENAGQLVTVSVFTKISDCDRNAIEAERDCRGTKRTVSR